MSGEALTIDGDKVSAAAGKAAGKMAQSVAAPVLDTLQSAKDIGIGGSWIDDLIKWIQGFFSSIGDFIGSIFKSIFGGAAKPTPAAPAPAPAPTPPAPTTPEVSSPGRTPSVPQAERTERPRGRP